MSEGVKYGKPELPATYELLKEYTLDLENVLEKNQQDAIYWMREHSMEVTKNEMQRVEITKLKAKIEELVAKLDFLVPEINLLN